MDPYALPHPPTPSHVCGMFVFVRENGWTDGKIDGRMDGWMDGRYNPDVVHICTMSLDDIKGAFELRTRQAFVGLIHRYPTPTRMRVCGIFVTSRIPESSSPCTVVGEPGDIVSEWLRR